MVTNWTIFLGTKMNNRRHQTQNCSIMLANINPIIFGMQKIPYPNNNTRRRNDCFFFTQHVYAKYPILRIFFPFENWTYHAFHLGNQTIFPNNRFGPRKFGCLRILQKCKWDNTSHTCLLLWLFSKKYFKNILEIFLKILNLKKKKTSYYFVKVYVKNLAKKSFKNNLKSIYKSFYCFKKNVIMFD